MSRKKGYIEWSPSPEVQGIVHQVKGILREYGQYGPMTVRQIFYRLVGQHGYDKTERAYKRLAEYLVKARRSQMIAFSAIRDDGGTSAGGAGGFETVDEFLEDLADYSKGFAFDPTLGQPHHVMVYCEAEGMVPMLAQMTQGLGVRVTGTGGFSSLTVTHGIAQEVVARGKPTVFLHVGDYDPSGESIFESTCQDIGAFVVENLGGRWNSQTGETIEVDGVEFEPRAEGSFFIPRRVALTEAQVEEYDLPSEPPKASDSRSANWGGLAATQAEAMPPDVLADVIREAVMEWVDEGLRQDVLQRSEEGREAIGTRIEEAINELRDELSDHGAA